MENWRRGKVDNYNSEAGRTRSRYKKPPNVGGWQQTVPSWEKKFCASVCSIPWWKIMEMKSTIHIYNNILKWDDSAGNEAFNNAKTRFLANMCGFQCDVPIPDPDMYIDEINWDSKNDPELELDLEYDPQVPNDSEKGESVVIFDTSFVSNQGFSGTGWGDAEQDNVKNVVNTSAANNEKSWGGVGNYGGEEAVEYGWNNNGWGDGWNNTRSWGWNGNYNDSYGQNSQGTGGYTAANNEKSWGGFGNYGGEEAVKYGWNNNGWGDGWNNTKSWGWNGNYNDSYGQNGRGTRGYTQQYRGPSYRGGQGQNWKNGNGKRRGNYYVSEKQGRDSTRVS